MRHPTYADAIAVLRDRVESAREAFETVYKRLEDDAALEPGWGMNAAERAFELRERARFAARSAEAQDALAAVRALQPEVTR